MSSDFTLEKAIAIQKKQLKAWQSVLKEDAYLKLENWVKEKNKSVTKPEEVKRGVDLDVYVHNNIMKH